MVGKLDKKDNGVIERLACLIAGFDIAGIACHGGRVGANHVVALDAHPPLSRADLIGSSLCELFSADLWTLDLQMSLHR